MGVGKYLPAVTDTQVTLHTCRVTSVQSLKGVRWLTTVWPSPL